jgi:hypothetical protein
MGRFLRRWASVIFPWRHLGVLTGAFKLLIAVLGTTLIVGLLTFFGSLHLPWWGFVLILLVVFWASLTAGIAFEQSRGPVIEVGPLEIDVPVRIFHTILRNNASFPVNVVGRIVARDESLGIRHTEHAWQGHLRGRPPEFRRVDPPPDEPDYAWLGVTKFESGNPTLYIFSNDRVLVAAIAQAGHGVIPVSRDLPIEQQSTIEVALAIDCETLPDEKGKVERGIRVERTYRIAPDPGSTVGYRILTGPPVPSRAQSKCRSAICYLLKALRSLRPAARARTKRHAGRRRNG